MAAAFIIPMVAITPEAGAVSLPKKMPNGKVCRTNFGIEAHFHGANGAKPSKDAAQTEAIRDWSRFTAFEYGRRWGNWSLAIGHSMTCAHDTNAGVWRCRAEAQPCRS